MEGDLSEAAKVKIAMGAVQLPTGKMVFSHEQEVEATMYGFLAVHRAADRWAARWVVTHVPTGMQIMDVGTKELAIRAAKALQHFPWNEVTVKGIKRWKHKKAAIKAITDLRAEFASEGKA